MRTHHRPDLDSHDLLAVKLSTELLSDVIRPFRSVYVLDRDVDVAVRGIRGGDGQVKEASQRLARGSGLLEQFDVAVIDAQDWLHAQRGTNRGGSLADSTTPFEVLESVYVEVGAGSSRARSDRGSHLFNFGAGLGKQTASKLALATVIGAVALPALTWAAYFLIG